MANANAGIVDEHLITVAFVPRGGHFDGVTASESCVTLTYFLHLARYFAPSIAGRYDFHITARTKRSGITPELSAPTQTSPNHIEFDVVEDPARFRVILHATKEVASLLTDRLDLLCELVSTGLLIEPRKANKLITELHERTERLNIPELDQAGLNAICREEALQVNFLQGGKLALTPLHLLVLLDYFARQGDRYVSKKANGVYTWSSVLVGASGPFEGIREIESNPLDMVGAWSDEEVALGIEGAEKDLGQQEARVSEIVSQLHTARTGHQTAEEALREARKREKESGKVVESLEADHKQALADRDPIQKKLDLLKAEHAVRINNRANEAREGLRKMAESLGLTLEQFLERVNQT